jgi:structural maintenance of chromosome 3 (chondroitin sulfate proteoglycan 6)
LPSFHSYQSNLLDAIQFVLSDKYSALRSEDRQKLLHEGAGRDTTVADVEIVFDNSSGQIPLDPPKGDKDNKEVRMRRTIGGKKDQILVNNTPYTSVKQNKQESREG